MQLSHIISLLSAAQPQAGTVHKAMGEVEVTDFAQILQEWLDPIPEGSVEKLRSLLSNSLEPSRGQRPGPITRPPQLEEELTDEARAVLISALLGEVLPQPEQGVGVESNPSPLRSREEDLPLRATGDSAIGRAHGQDRSVREVPIPQERAATAEPMDTIVPAEQERTPVVLGGGPQSQVLPAREWDRLAQPQLDPVPKKEQVAPQPNPTQWESLKDPEGPFSRQGEEWGRSVTERPDVPSRTQPEEAVPRADLAPRINTGEMEVKSPSGNQGGRDIAQGRSDQSLRQIPPMVEVSKTEVSPDRGITREDSADIPVPRNEKGQKADLRGMDQDVAKPIDQAQAQVRWESPQVAPGQSTQWGVPQEADLVRPVDSEEVPMTEGRAQALEMEIHQRPEPRAQIRWESPPASPVRSTQWGVPQEADLVRPVDSEEVPMTEGRAQAQAQVRWESPQVSPGQSTQWDELLVSDEPQRDPELQLEMGQDTADLREMHRVDTEEVPKTAGRTQAAEMEEIHQRPEPTAQVRGESPSVSPAQSMQGDEPLVRDEPQRDPRAQEADLARQVSTEIPKTEGQSQVLGESPRVDPGQDLELLLGGSEPEHEPRLEGFQEGVRAQQVAVHPSPEQEGVREAPVLEGPQPRQMKTPDQDLWDEMPRQSPVQTKTEPVLSREIPQPQPQMEMVLEGGQVDLMQVSTPVEMVEPILGGRPSVRKTQPQPDTSPVEWRPRPRVTYEPAQMLAYRQQDLQREVPSERMEVKDLNPQRLGEVIEEVIKRPMQTPEPVRSIRIQLNPKELGEMEIDLSLEDGRISGEIRVASHQIQELLRAVIPGLESQLRSQGIEVGGFACQTNSQSKERNADEEKAPRVRGRSVTRKTSMYQVPQVGPRSGLDLRA